MDPKDNAPSGCQSQTSVQSSVRLKVDKTWDHVTQHIEGNGRKAYTMEGLLKENDHKLKQKGIEFAESNVLFYDDEEQQVREASQPKTGKRKATASTHPFFTKGINDASQPTIKKAMQTKKKLHDVDLAIGMWFYDACIPMNACNSLYFQHAVDKITTVGFGYKAPSYHALKVNLQRHLINFLVYCSSGISFIKYVDASNIKSNAENLCNLFSEIVEMVGVKNVVQMVTDNGANYKAARILLSERYRTVTWSPCAAHCLNLVLKDVLESDNVKEIITLASRFDRENLCKKREVFQGILDMAEKHYSGDELTDLNKAIGMFRDSKGNFGRISAVQGRTKHRPETQGELDYDQLENMLEQEPPSQTQGLVDEDDDDSWYVFKYTYF
uniref:DUF659 domain-containing protein n=1 Tax=Tanacetum cinerariifolium TaxID=118510 RepID=A0A699K4J8_TANCI|nr:hypothetical protein [Tanacetum cinerariifolium]